MGRRGPCLLDRLQRPAAVNAWTRLADEQYCYLTTRGRVSGRPHRIEIWFALDRDTLYLLSGGRERSDWVKNLHQTPEVTVELGGDVFAGRARIVDDEGEDERARRLVEWMAVLQGPASAGMIVVTAASGGMFRETMAMSKPTSKDAPCTAKVSCLIGAVRN